MNNVIELQKVVFLTGNEVRSLHGEVIKENDSWVWLKTLNKIDKISKRFVIKIENVGEDVIEERIVEAGNQGTESL